MHLTEIVVFYIVIFVKKKSDVSHSIKLNFFFIIGV